MSDPCARPLDAVVAGYLGVDLAPTFAGRQGAVGLAELLRPGRLVEVGALELSLGGAVANTGLALGRFGRRVALMGVLGEDPLGDVALGLLRRHEVTLCLRRSRGATAYGIVIAPPGTDRVFLECPGGNAEFSSADLDMDVVAQSRLFHFGYPPLMPSLLVDGGTELVAMFSRVQGLGVVTSLDMSLPDPDGPAGGVDWRALLTRVLPHVDIFAPSLEELLFMLAPAEYARLAGETGASQPVEALPQSVAMQLADEALELGAGLVLVKAGHQGGYVRSGMVDSLGAVGAPTGNWANRELRLPPFPADPGLVRNASGAGDAAVAGFLAALLSGETIERAGAYAMLAGRDNLYGPDALSGLTDWDTMTKAIAGHPPA